MVGEVTASGPIGTVPQRAAGDWNRVLGRMRREVGETAYRSWFGSMTVERVAGGEGVIAVPTRFLRDWVTTHYGDRLLALWRSENNEVHRISFVVDPFRTRGERSVATAEPALPVGASETGAADIVVDN